MKKYILGILCIVLIGFADNIWVETTQEDFADGIYEKNIYASHFCGGTIEFAPRFDLNNDGYIDLFSAIAFSYVAIYWGSDSGYYPGSQTNFPIGGIGNCEASDLNMDGYAEFIACHGDINPRLAIYWGSPTGPSPGNAFDITTPVNNEACYVADLNKDGYLDIIIGVYLNHSTGSIFWGSATGYSTSNRTDLPTAFGCHNIEVADLNEDDWLDIIFANNNSSNNYIYWGSAGGYSSGNMTSLPAPPATPHGVSVADLNADAYLDLIFTSVYHNQSYLYYGSASGYQTYQVLNTGSTYGGSAVCNINNDEYLDIIFIRGWPSTYEQIIYWGSATGYSDANSTEIGYPINGSGGFVADLNGDNYFDIFVNNRGAGSPIFWGPDYTTSNTFPGSGGDHHTMFREIGNVYNREYYDDYVSSVFDAGETKDWGTIEWDASLPEGTSMLFWVRSGETSAPDTSWTDWCEVTNGGLIPEELNARYLQYKARLAYTNPAYLPALYEVRVSAEEAIPARVRIIPRVINLKCPHRFIALIKLRKGYNHGDIDVSTVQCEGAPALWGFALPWFYIAVFHARDLVGVSPGYGVKLVVTGQLYDGTPFSGYDRVCVIGPAIVEDREVKVTAACRPNPFKERTRIVFSHEDQEPVSVKIYNINGRLIRTLHDTYYHRDVGSVMWNRRDNAGRIVPAGIYFYKIQGKTTAVTRKVVVID